MKTIALAFTLGALAFFGSAPEAEAGHSSRTYISGYRSCGTPIYSERYFIGYDDCGHAIWGTRVVRSYYRPVSRPRYVAPCPPPRYVPRHCDY